MTTQFDTNHMYSKKMLSKLSFNKLLVHGELIAAVLSGLLILTTWSLKSHLSPSFWVSLHIIAFIIGGFAQAKEGILDTINEKELNVELLMIFAAIGSAAIGYWTEGAVLIFIFALAGALETYTLNKSNREISSLMALQPEEAVLIENNIDKVIPISELNVGDHIFVRASERIPADGRIIKGMTSVDESAITGESMPVSRDVHEDVFAGTVALNGSITVEITKQASETLFQKIINMVQSAQDEKSPTQLFIEKFEGVYVNIVIATVIIMMFLPHFLFNWSWTESIYRAMILLVVASPCALVASIMPATLSAISKSAQQGVLFKGGVHAESLSNMTLFAFDKTGTLTNGKPIVTDVHLDSDYDAAHLISIVGAIEKESTHPLARAITEYSLDQNGNGVHTINIIDMNTVGGNGVTACVEQEIWKIGKATFVGEENASTFKNNIAQTLSEQGKTVVFAAKGKKVIAVFGLEDTIRDVTKEAIQSLTKQGVTPVMLTGDHEVTAHAIAREAGIKEYIAQCLPADKVAFIKQAMKNDKVAMVGDGINDAPALATADLGIAMGEATDVALETADIVLMKNDLTKITDAINLSQKMNRIVKQNVFFSLAVIATLIVSNFFQAIDLPLGVIGHEGSTILVILNGLRLLK